jgi:hypothetical protein
MPSLDITGFQTEGFRLLCEFVTYENFPGTPAEAMERLHRVSGTMKKDEEEKRKRGY